MSGQCPPHLQVTSPTNSYTLSCKNPTLLATGTSTSTDTQISWLVPSTPSLINSPTVIIGPPNGPPTTSTSLTYANYTVVVTNTALACASQSVIQISQNFRPPKCTAAVSIGTPTTICNNTSPVLTTGPSTTILWPPFIDTPCWSGPLTPTPICGSNAYTASIAGIYTLTIIDNYNGCSATDTIIVKDSRPQFSLHGTASSSSASCDGSLIINTKSPNEYSLSASSGSLNGTSLTQLCYGWVKVCVTNTNSECFKCDSLLMNEATTLTEYHQENEMQIFPNPSHSSVFIQCAEEVSGVIKIRSYDGREIKEEVIDSEKLIEIKQLDAGIYFAELNYKNKTIRKKIIVLK